MAWRLGPEGPVSTMRWARIAMPIFRLAVSIAAVLAVTAVLYRVPLHNRSLAASLTFLPVVLIVSAFWGFRYALFVSLLTVLGFAWLLPPVGRFWLNDPRDVFTLAAFLAIGITAGYFSDRARGEALNANRRRAEAVAAQERFRDLVNSVEGIVCEVDAATFAVLFVNEQAEPILGYPAEKWLNEPAFWKDHLHPEDRDRAVQFCEEAKAGRQKQDFEYRMIAADGRVVWLRGLVTVVVENGRASRLRGVMIDITERKRAEQAQQELEEQSRAAFESNPTMYFIVNAAGKIVSVNGFGAEQLGYSVSELVGQPVLNVFYEPDRDAVQKHANECFEQPGRMMRWEARKIRKDGAMLWVRETANAVVLKKQPVLLVVCENITEQKRAEDAARRSEKELREVFETMPAMAWSALPDGSNAFVNREWAEYTGLSAEQTSGSGWKDAVHPEDLDRHVEKWHRSLATGQPFEHEDRLRRVADGQYRWFLVRGVALRDEQGNILRWYGIATDIEDRKRAEALLTGEKRILEMVAKGDSLAQILDNLCRLVEEQASGALASILLVDGNRLCHGGAPSLPKEYTDAIDGVVVGPSVGSCGTAAYRGEQVIVKDIATDPLWTDYREAALTYSLHACWSTPVFSSQGNVIATFAMYYREPRGPSPSDQEIIKQITHLAGVAIERKLIQDALRRSEAYLAEAQRLTKTGSWAYNPSTGKTVYWSDEMFRIFGLDPQGGPSSKDFWQRVHPEDHERIRARVEREAHEKLEYVDNYRIVLPDGTVKHILDIGRPVPNGAGDVVEFVGTTVDVTERKRAEETLRRSEAYLAEAQRLSKTGSFAWSPVTHELLYWSDEMCRILGFDPQQGPPSMEIFWERLHPEDRDGMDKLMWKAVHEKAEYVHDLRVVLPGGTVKHIHTIGHPLLDATGKVVELIGTTIDVTERKQAQEALRRSEAYLAEAQRLTHTGSWAWSPATGETLYWSEEMFRIFAFDPQHGPPPTETFWERVHPEDRESMYELIHNAVLQKTEYAHDHRIVLPGGTVKHIHAIGHPLLDAAGEVVEFVGTSIDVTERKRAEAERERLRQLEEDLARINRVSMMGELTASLAHEIKQPIAAAVSNAEACLQWLARDQPDLVEVREATTEMVKEARRAAEIITRTRSLFKKEEMTREVVDLNEVITDTVSLIREGGDRSSISVRTELDAELPRISADRVQLQQVLMNLMLNGLEAMMGSRGELIIRSQRDEEGRPLISVSDDGIGLPAGEGNKIFDAFFTTKPQGIGMGLAISRSIVESHGGRLWATANSGPGTTFYFTLPAEPLLFLFSAG